MFNILVCDDEKEIVDAIEIYLMQEGYNVLKAFNGKQALEILKEKEVHLLILDLMMPELDGLGACQQIRMFSAVPIIMLTAKSEDADKLLGFESGADDYITKPFNILELKARVRALLRRSSVTAALQKTEQKESALLVKGHITLDTEKRQAFKDSVPVELTMKEYDLIEFFMKKPGKVFSRENLLDLVWGYDYQGDIRTVDVHIRRLREKLEQNPASPAYILTKWGVGYYFVD